MKHLLLLLICSSFAISQNCNYLMIDDYCTKTADDDFERYEFTKHEHYNSVMNKLSHLKIKQDSVTISYFANCKDMMRFFMLNFTDSLLTGIYIEQPTGRRKKDLEGFFHLSIENVKEYYVSEIKYVTEEGAVLFDNDCYIVEVRKEKKAVSTTILMK